MLLSGGRKARILRAPDFGGQVRAVVAAEYERRSDIDVMFELAVRLGLGEAFFEGNVEAALDEMISPLGTTMAELRRQPAGISVTPLWAEPPLWASGR